MDRKKDPMEEIIKEDLQIIAETIDRQTEAADVEELSIEDRERIREKLHARIEAYEKERVYKSLSEEDRQALELGRKMLKEKESGAEEAAVVRRKKCKKMWLVLAAVLVLVMAIGVTGIGGAERIAEIMRRVVGVREVVQIDTEDNYVITNEKEEEAYQELKDVFGVEPVKLFHRPDGMEFVEAEIDGELQTAVLRYKYKESGIHLYISSHFTDSSWGIDIEDKIVSQYYLNNRDKREIEIIEYETLDNKERYYSSSFEYMGLEYFLIGVMEKNCFEEIVKNLIFF